MFACVNRQTSKGTSEMSNQFPDAESTQPNDLGRFRKSLFAVDHPPTLPIAPCTQETLQFNTFYPLYVKINHSTVLFEIQQQCEKRMFRSHEYSTYRVTIVVIIVVSPSQARFPALPHRLPQKASNLVVISEHYHDHSPCIHGLHDHRSYSRPQSPAARHTSG
jgi:hypothetical protein